MVACLASALSGACPTVAPTQYNGSPSLEGYQADSLRTGNLRSETASYCK